MSTEPKGPMLVEYKTKYCEDGDCMGNETENYLEVEVVGLPMPEDAYIIIKTDRWAIDPDGFDAFVALLRNAFNHAVKGKTDERND